MSIITFEDKVSLKEDSSLARVNKITDNDINEIKNSVNALYNSGRVLSASGLILSTDILTGWDTPVEILAAQGANTWAVAKFGVLQLIPNSSRYNASQDGC